MQSSPSTDLVHHLPVFCKNYSVKISTRRFVICCQYPDVLEALSQVWSEADPDTRLFCAYRDSATQLGMTSSDLDQVESAFRTCTDNSAVLLRGPSVYFDTDLAPTAKGRPVKVNQCFFLGAHQETSSSICILIFFVMGFFAGQDH